MVPATSKGQYQNNFTLTGFNIITSSFIQQIFFQGPLNASEEKLVNKTEKKKKTTVFIISQSH